MWFVNSVIIMTATIVVVVLAVSLMYIAVKRHHVMALLRLSPKTLTVSSYATIEKEDVVFKWPSKIKWESGGKTVLLEGAHSATVPQINIRMRFIAAPIRVNGSEIQNGPKIPVLFLSTGSFVHRIVRAHLRRKLSDISAMENL